MASPASQGLLELSGLEMHEGGGSRKSSSSSLRRYSHGGADEDDGEDVPATVSVLPLLANAGATGSSESQRLHASASSNATASRHAAHESAVLMSGSGSSSSSHSPWRSSSSQSLGVSSSSPPAHEASSMVGGGSAAPSSADPIVVGHNLHKTYLLGVEGVPALRGVSLTIARGEFIMILGSSGGGKSSLLNILGTIDKPTKGELRICGHRINAATSDEEFAWLRLKKIGFVFQTFNLLPSMTAEENVALPMILEGRLSASEISARARELLERVGLGERLDHLPSQLSGGEQQRVTIARAIANRPAILLLDEPTGDLDTVNGTIILSLLLHLNRLEQITCIMVTHDTALKHYAHRVVHMVDGKVARIEAIDEQRRQDMDDKLKLKVQQIRGEWSGEIPAPAEPTTEFREAEDYESFLRADDDDE